VSHSQPAEPAVAPAASLPSTPLGPGPRIVVLGDSLTAGLGLAPDQAYPALLQKRLDAAGLKYEVVNAGVSGDTSAGGLRRVDWALDGDVKVLIVALGGNDALRGLPVEQLRQNLTAIVERAKARGIKVILAGMEAPPNFGASYTAAFRETYRDVAKAHGAVLIPFLLDGVAGLPEMNQGDGIHPTAAGAQRVADIVWTALQPLVAHE
jgi:acyl-CoA thioesterase-1